jgi:hypothetical protein
MNRPRLFLSAISEELKSTRQAVAATVRNLGFDPVSQDDFPTGYGELRKWLREQIDSCKGIIQLVGHGYGAEPPEVDPDYGRVSYTQFEFLYAGLRNKKTWVIVIGDGCRRDKPIDQLDLPREPGHADPAGYQAERRKLQQDYIERLKRENHLRHSANNDTELQNIILRLRDDLGELRKQWEDWLERDNDFRARTTSRLNEIAEATRLAVDKIQFLEEPSIDKLVQEATDALNFNDFEKSIKTCNKIFNLNQKSPEANLIAAVALIKGRNMQSLNKESIALIESNLQCAVEDPVFAYTAWVIWGVVKFDYYFLGRRIMGTPSLDQIKQELNKANIMSLNRKLVKKIKVSSTAKKFFGLDTIL